MWLAKCNDKYFSGLPVYFANVDGKFIEAKDTPTKVENRDIKLTNLKFENNSILFSTDSKATNVKGFIYATNIDELEFTDIELVENKIANTKLTKTDTDTHADSNDKAVLSKQIKQIYGDWREVFREVDKVNAITPEDIQRVAKLYFTRNNRTVATIETESEESMEASK